MKQIISIIFIISFFSLVNAEQIQEDDAAKTPFNEIEKQALIDFYAAARNQRFSPISNVPDDPCLWDGVLCVDKNHFEIALQLRSEKIELTEFPFPIESFIVPDNFSNLIKLKSLSLINYNVVTSFPDSFNQLINLEKLYIRGNIARLPQDMTPLSRLVDLSLSKQDQFPENFSQLSHLKSLTLTNNQAEALPESYANFTELEILILRRNDFTSLPDNFYNFPKLKVFYLSDFKIKELPEKFGNFPLLEDLYINNYKLIKLPQAFGIHPKLKNLHITGLKSLALPREFGDYPELVSLYIKNTNLASMGDKFTNLTQLKYLLINSNGFLTTLPNGFGNMPLLQYGMMQGNKLTTLPEGFGNGMELQFLFLNHNELTSLPESFGNLSVLQELRLDFNQLTVLPENFGHLKIGSSLSLEHNQLTSLPDSFNNLSLGNGLPLIIALGLDTYISENGELSDADRTIIESNEIFGQYTDSFPKFEVFLKDYYQFFSKYSGSSYGSLINENIFDNNNNIYDISLALILNDNHLKSLPEGFGNLNKIQLLILSNNELTTLPEDFGNLNKIQFLTLNNNELTTLPESFGRLFNLESLELVNNQLTTLPENFGRLFNLKSLDLTNNQLTTLPENFGNLVNLEDLYLAHNQLKALPEGFGNLTQLKSLFLEHNQIQSLPDYFGDLSQVLEIHLEYNQLQSLPESFSYLMVNKLYLDHNKLSTLPTDFGFLRSINSDGIIELSHNQLHTLPNNFSQLGDNGFYSINLGYNLLATLPRNFSDLSTRYLNLEHNQLRRLNHHFIHSEWQTLKLNHNQLDQLPSNFDNLYLNELDLSHNKLMTLPDDFLISNQKLTVLDLAFNQFTTFPSQLIKLKTLNRLSLQSNEIQFLSNDIGNLNRLLLLDLGHNQLTNLPRSIKDLESIHTLNLESNQLTALPETVTNLINLEQLNLRYNQISFLPETMSNLVNIKTLDLSHNNLKGGALNILNYLGTTNQRFDLSLSLFDNQITGDIPADLTHILSPDDLDKSVDEITLTPDPTKPIAIIITSNHDFNPSLTQNASNRGNLAYRVLKARQLPDENILYLNKKLNQGADIKVFGTPTKPLLREIFSHWLPRHAHKNQKIIIYQIKYGTDQKFIYDLTDKAVNYLSSRLFDHWLDWRTNLPEDQRPSINFITDYAYAEANEYYYAYTQCYYNQSNVGFIHSSKTVSDLFSFSLSFWSSLYNSNLNDSFKQAISDMNKIYNVVQTPSYNCAQDSNKFGLPAPFKPTILPKVTQLQIPAEILNENQVQVRLKIDLPNTTLNKVWVTVISPSSLNTNKITNAPKFVLTYDNQSKQYTGTITDLNEDGIYQIIGLAENNQKIISLPKIEKILVQHNELPKVQVKMVDDNLTIYLPRVSFADKNYQVTLKSVLFNDPTKLSFQLVDGTLLENNNKVGINNAMAYQNNLDIHIPFIKFNGRYYTNVLLDTVYDPEHKNPPIWRLDLLKLKEN